MSEPKKPIVKEIAATELEGYALRFRCDTIAGWMPEHNTRRSHWVDFEIFETVGQNEDGSFIYMNHDEPFEASLDRASPVVTGFVKWDGCTQFWFGDEKRAEVAHVDTKEQLDRLFAAIHLARVECAAICLMEGD